MRPVYLLATEEFDNLFGWRKDQMLEYVNEALSELVDRIASALPCYDHQPAIRDVFIVQDNKQITGCRLGKTGIIDADRKRLRVRDVALDRNPDLILKGSYLDELDKYIKSSNTSDRVVIANTMIAHEVKTDVERLACRENVKARICIPEQDKEAERTFIRNMLTPRLNPDGSVNLVPEDT